jgi:hypothetical protein
LISGQRQFADYVLGWLATQGIHPANDPASETR